MKLTDPEYFAHEAISNSKLSLINPAQGGYPELYEQGFNEEKSYSKALETGSHIHLALLEPERFTTSDTRKPGGKLGIFIDAVFAKRLEGKTIQESISEASIVADYGTKWSSNTLLSKAIPHLDYYVELLHPSDKVVMADDIYEKVMKAVAAVKASEECNVLFPEGNVEVFNEDALFSERTIKVVDNLGLEQEIKLDLKAKIDCWHIDYDLKTVTLIDLKTTGRSVDNFAGYWQTYPIRKFIEGSFHKFHYYRQIAFYFDVLLDHVQKEYKLTGDWNLKVCIVVVETSNHYRTGVYQISDQTIKHGRDEYLNLLERIAHCKANGFVSNPSTVI